MKALETFKQKRDVILKEIASTKRGETQRLNLQAERKQAIQPQIDEIVISLEAIEKETGRAIFFYTKSHRDRYGKWEDSKCDARATYRLELRRESIEIEVSYCTLYKFKDVAYGSSSELLAAIADFLATQLYRQGGYFFS